MSGHPELELPAPPPHRWEAESRQPRLCVTECGITEARRSIRVLHRHHPKPPPSGLVAFRVSAEGRVCGYALVGRPCSRVLQSRGVIEVTRVATDGTPNACSALYGAAARWARDRKAPIVTYTMESESGASLRGAGWIAHHTTGGGQWDCPSRARSETQGGGVPKVRWAPAWALGGIFSQSAKDGEE